MITRLAVVLCGLLVATVPGIATAQSVRDLLNIIVNPPTTTPRTTTPRAAIPGATASVAEMQRLLNASGFPAGAADGVSGSGTVRAVVAFQRSNGFPATGILTPSEMEILRATARPSRSEPQGVNLRGVQSGLAELGFDPGPVDGKWGRRSQSALDSFRQDRGIARRGPPITEDLAMLSAGETPAPAPLPGAADRSNSLPLPGSGPPLNLQTQGPGEEMLASLPVVDGGKEFRVAWTGSGGDEFWLAILPEGTDPEPGVPAWPLGPQSPILLRAPESPGSYEIVWVDTTDGSVRMRRPLDVR